MVVTSLKDSAKDEALKKAPELRPPIEYDETVAASRVCDERLRRP